MALQDLGELTAGEPVALVGVEHLRPALTQRFCQRIDAEVRLRSAPKVWDSRQVTTNRLGQSTMTTTYRKPRAMGRCDVGSPHLVGASNFDFFQQIRKGGYTADSFGSRPTDVVIFPLRLPIVVSTCSDSWLPL